MSEIKIDASSSQEKGESLPPDKLGELKVSAEILVVDDEEIVRQLLSDVLRDDGHRVSTASSGEEALEKVKKNRFDLILTDIRMPGMDGLEVIQRLKQNQCDADIIVMTGYASVKTAVESMKLGARDYLTKPLNIDQIRIVLSKTLERKKLELKATEGEFYKELSQTDGLTDLYNHRHFHQLLMGEIDRAKRYNHPISLLMIDIDYFKIYNDSNGHPTGDVALKQIAWILKQYTRNCDYRARYGGDEFAIIIPETDRDEALAMGNRLLKKIAETNFKGEQVLPEGTLTVSIGLATFPHDAQTKEELIEKADKALYQAKASGRNRIYVFNPK